jgi:hypothetical protein
MVTARAAIVCPCAARVAELERLFAVQGVELARLTVLVEARAALSRSDCARLTTLLPMIAGALGSSPFLVRELYVHESPDLRLGLIGIGAKALGRMLRRASGVSLAGHVVERVDREAGSTLWRVLAVVP